MIGPDPAAGREHRRNRRQSIDARKKDGGEDVRLIGRISRVSVREFYLKISAAQIGEGGACADAITRANKRQCRLAYARSADTYHRGHQCSHAILHSGPLSASFLAGKFL